MLIRNLQKKFHLLSEIQFLFTPDRKHIWWQKSFRSAKLLLQLHIHTVTQKANKIMAVIKRTFVYLDSNTIKLLFKAIVRPHLEYGVLVWYPYKKKEKDCIEDVQRRAIRQIRALKNLTYEERLKRLELPTLMHRRSKGIWWKSTKYFITSTTRVVDGLLILSEETRTREHSLKLAKRSTVIGHLPTRTFTHPDIYPPFNTRTFTHPDIYPPDNYYIRTFTHLIR